MDLKKIKQLDVKILENEPLQNHTTFQIGGPARYFIEVKKTEALIEILKFAKNMAKKLLGRSNVLGGARWNRTEFLCFLRLQTGAT